jgi:hypothetical protein
VMYRTGVKPPVSSGWRNVLIPRRFISGVIPPGVVRSIPIVIGAAIAAGGTIIVPPNDPIDGSGTLVALEIGVN